MQNQPLVSFIIPVYNIEADMLRECLESITALSLSRQDREIILVDDGSDLKQARKLILTFKNFLRE